MLASLAVRWPGVKFRTVPDMAAAAEHIAVLTRALAEQPYVKVRIGSAARRCMHQHLLSHAFNVEAS